MRQPEFWAGFLMGLGMMFGWVVTNDIAKEDVHKACRVAIEQGASREVLMAVCR